MARDARSTTAATEPAALARRVDGPPPPGDDFTYSVGPTERRGVNRQRTRLKSGKLIRKDGQFLCECLVHNMSPSGCRLKLPSAAIPLEPGLFLYDDQSELLFQGRVIWKNDREAGLRLLPCPPNPLHRSIAGAMRGKFYALKR